MLDNTISLSVDILNNGTTAAKTYSRFDEYNNRTVYISENHEPGSRDLLTFYRTFPKPTGLFKGVKRTAAKFTKDVAVLDSAGGTVDSSIIFELSASVPVGVTPAQTLEMRQRMIAILDDDSIMAPLQDVQSI